MKPWKDRIIVLQPNFRISLLNTVHIYIILVVDKGGSFVNYGFTSLSL